MKMGILVTILAVTSVAHAVDTCNQNYIRKVEEQPQPQRPLMPKIENQSYWIVTMTKDDASYYNASSMKIDFGNYDSETDSARSSITVYRRDGSKNVIVFDMTERSSYMFEKEYDGDYESHFFSCNEKLTGNYRCLSNIATRSNKPLLDIFCKMNYIREDISDDELDSCKQALRKIDPTAEFEDLAYPYAKRPSCKQSVYPDNRPNI